MNIEDNSEKDEKIEDYKDIVLEINDKVLKFISSFKIGSLLSLEVLVDLADKYDCEDCNITVYSKSLFIEHGMSIHGEKKQEEVTELLESISGESPSNNFQQEVEKEEPEQFDDKSSEETLIPSEFICQICDKTFLRQSWLVKHSFSHPQLNKEVYPCFHCTNVYDSKQAKYSYTKHVDRLIAREERTCETCGHMAKSEEHLKIHKQIKHFGIKKYRCDFEECAKQFSTNKYLKVHRRTHESSIIFPCDKCEFTTKLRTNLAKHRTRSHNEDSTENLSCTDCTYYAPNKEKLQSHFKSHHGDFFHECAECGKKFRDRRKYMLHLKRDHEGIRYKCEICEKTFTMHNVMQAHKKREHEGFTLDCDKCTHVATSQRALRFHTLKTHEKTPFQCDICSFTGTSFEYLDSHKNKIHNGISYKCAYCDHVLYNKSLFKYHIKQKHPENEIFVNEPHSIQLEVEKPKDFINSVDALDMEGLNQDLQEESHVIPSITYQSIPDVTFEEFKEIRNKDEFTIGSEIVELKQELMHEAEKQNEVMSSDHNPAVKKTGKGLKCDECGKWFSNRRKLYKHKMSVHKEEKHPCDECGKWFSHKSNVYMHKMSIHKGEKHPCEHCQYKFTTKSNLKRHVYKAHTEQ